MKQLSQGIIEAVFKLIGAIEIFEDGADPFSGVKLTDGLWWRKMIKGANPIKIRQCLQFVDDIDG